MDNPEPTNQQPPPPGGPGPRVSRDEMKDLGRLRRSVTDRHIGGVAGGLARHLDVDPIIIRVALVISIFFGGAGLIAYVGAWILLPEEGTLDEPLGLDPRSRSVALIGLGVLVLISAVGSWATDYAFPWWLAVAAVFVVWFLHRQSSQRGLPHHAAPVAYAQGAPVPPVAGGAAPDPHAPLTAPLDYSRAGSSSVDASGVDYARVPPSPSRRRGPILFFFTLALIALAEGVLGVIDLAGTDVPASAYPAMALGITAAMLLVGSFWGRAGGLIALGLVAAIATSATTAGSHVIQDSVTYAPISASEVRDSYDLGGGDLFLDLSGVDDVSELQGREISIDSVGGRIEVIVPDGMDVAVQSQVVVGQSRVFDQTQSGFDVNLGATRSSGVPNSSGSPDLSITIDLVAGEVIVREAA